VLARNNSRTSSNQRRERDTEELGFMAQFIAIFQYSACWKIPYAKGLAMQFEGPNIGQGSGIFDSAAFR
jgi:hypothetical protein